jgi:hypothetical protein
VHTSFRCFKWLLIARQRELSLILLQVFTATLKDIGCIYMPVMLPKLIFIDLNLCQGYDILNIISGLYQYAACCDVLI